MARRLFRNSKALLALVILPLLLAGIGVGIVRAVTVNGGTIGGFEADGNQVVDTAGNIDWASTTSPPRADVVDDTADSGFTQGSKEEDPANWVCGTGGADPNKGNILRAYVNPRIDKNSAYLDLAWVREGVSGGGDVHLNFEFNQVFTPTPSPFVPGACPITRVNGDLLITYDFPGGNGAPTIRAFRWNATTGHWVEVNLTSADVAAAVNQTPIADVLSGGPNIDIQRFGEASLNLEAIFNTGHGAVCESFGGLNVRSRSSGESITSALQDKLPSTPVDLSTCANIKVKKVDDHGTPLAGAVFGLFTDSNATNKVQECTTGVDGTCTFTKVNPGTYYVKEISAPANYTADTKIVQVDVGFRETKDLSSTPFVNPRDTGDLRIHKKLKDENGNPVTPPDLSVLNGATFVVYPDVNKDGVADSATPAKLWSNGNDATCSISNSLGYCDIGPLATGTYVVRETVAPAQTNNPGKDVPVTVAKGTRLDVDYVNTLNPLQISLDKSGPDFAHVGDTYTYTFTVTTSGPPLHNVQLQDTTPGGCTTAISGPTGDTGNDGVLEKGETWKYTCDHTVTAGGADPYVNTAKVTGTDIFGRSKSATAQHTVDILHPAITLDKKVNGADHATAGDALQVHSGDTVTYTVVAKNTSTDTPMTITAFADDHSAAVPSPACDKTVGAVLLPGDTVNCTYQASITDDTHNVASITAKDALGLTGDPNGAKSASDGTFVDVIHPAIKVVKSGPAVAHVGDKVTYSFKVTNTGDTALNNVLVSDDVLGTIGTIPSLAAGASSTLSADFVIPPGVDPVVNTVTACGRDAITGPNDPATCNTDKHTLDVLHPAIAIDKKVNGADHATAGDALQVHSGDQVTYTVVATNTSPDTDMTVTAFADDHAASVPASSCDKGLNTVLHPGDTIHCTYQATISSDTHNVVSITAKDALGLAGDPNGVKSASDGTYVKVINPKITVEKSASQTEAHEGNLVTYSFKVTNNGDVPLTNVEVNDNVLGPIGKIPSLAAGASATLTKDFTVPVGSGDIVNQVTACGLDPLSLKVCDTDEHHLPRIHPAISLDKKVNGADHATSGDALQVHAGDTVTYSVVAKNTSPDTPLTVTAFSDDHSSSVPNPSCDKGIGAVLQPGDTITCSYTAKITSDVHNVASITAKDPLGLAGDPKGVVTANDGTFVTVLHPSISLDKKVNGGDHATSGDALLVHSGNPVTYTVVATNTSADAPLTITAFSDDHAASVPNPSCDKGIGAVLQPGDTVHCTYTASITDDVHNVVSITAKDALGLAGDPAGVLTATDGTFVHVIHPAIKVEKSGPAEAHVGDAVTYSFKVTNTGDTTLNNIDVSDNVIGHIDVIPSLAPGASTTLTKDYVIPPNLDPVDNTVTVCGRDVITGPNDPATCGDDHHHLDVLHPALAVDKKVNGGDHATDGDALKVHAADSVTYTVVATNTSPDTDMTVTDFTDDHSSAVPAPACDKGVGTVLKPGDTIHCTYTASISDDVHNVVSITAKDSLGLKGDPNGVVTKTDGTFVKVINPNIEVVKSANKPMAHDGDPVTYSFKVTNTGDVALTNVKVTDDILGDIGTIASLDAGASQTLTKDFDVTPGSGDLINHVTACGTDPLDKEVCDHDSHNLPRIHPAITLDKKVNGADHATAGDALDVHSGDTVTYSVVAKNTGDTPLTVSALSDDHASSVPNPSCSKGLNTVLQPNETITCSYTAKITDDVHNVASITGKDPLGLTGDPKGVVTATDGTFVHVIHPAIDIVKSGPATAHEGDKVTYTFKVTNTGDVDLANVLVTDDKIGSIGTIDSLAKGASKTLSKDFTIPTPSTGVDNTATACGVDPLDLKVCDTDKHHLTPLHPAIGVVKSGPADATPGQVVTYTFKVTNTGDTDLKDVKVSDDKLGDIGTISSLPVGASTTLTKDFTVPNGVAAVDNTVTACGTDALSLQVCGTDIHHMTVTAVLGEVFQKPPLAVTGEDGQRRLLGGMAALLGGLGIAVSRRRRRQA